MDVNRGDRRGGAGAGPHRVPLLPLCLQGARRLRQQGPLGHAQGLRGTRREEVVMTQIAKPVVVLFDVDETLVHTGGAGARSWKAAFLELYGIPADIGAHTSAGETDPQVAKATFNG